MKTLKFNAPAHHTLVEDDEEVAGGETFKVTDERALELLTQPGIDVSEVGASKRTRDEWNKLAREAGVEDPEKLPNIPAVEAAIEEAKENQPGAESGDGQTTEQED